MKTLSRYFLRGLIMLLPFGITAYVLYKFLTTFEQLSGPTIYWFLGEYYWPGMGIVLGIVFIVLLGYLGSHRFWAKIFSIFEAPFKNVPIIKSVYSAIKNLADYFSGDGERKAQVVIVKLPNQDIEMVGFLTRPSLKDLPAEFTKEDKVGVYFPMSYQIGGYTAFIPRAWIRKTNIPVEVAMRSALTAWMPGRE